MSTTGEQEPANDRRRGDPPPALVDAVARELGQLAMAASQKVEALDQSMARLAAVGESVDRLANALMVGVASKEDVHRAGLAQDRKRRRVALVGGVFLILSLISSIEATVSAMRGADQRRLLVECTTPSQPGDQHECYENALVQQQKAIQQIIDALKASR